MRKVSIRLPDDVVEAYDSAHGTRSAVMRRILTGAVADGELDDVPEDLITLAAAEDAKDEGRLSRRRASYKKRVYQHFRDAWASGLVTDTDAEEMAESWETESALYGEEHMAFCDAVIEWYTDKWEPDSRPAWPEPSEFHLLADPGEVNVEDRLVRVVREAKEQGYSQHAAEARLTRYHGEATARKAVQEVF